MTGTDLGGLTLTPGVYCFTSSAQLTGTLTLDALGDPDASFVFQIGSTLTTATSAVVDVINGGTGCNVFWQVGSSATLGTGTTFVGNILALTSITAVNGTDVGGRLLALNGAVTLESNDVGAPPECLCEVATSVDIGPGCGNPIVPQLTITPPVLGQLMTLTITNGEPMSMTWFYVSPCGSTPFTIPGTDCDVYLDPNMLVAGSAGMTNGGGSYTFNWNVPDDPSTIGTCFTVQGLVWSNSGPFQGDSLTNGVEITFGCE